MSGISSSIDLGSAFDDVRASYPGIGRAPELGGAFASMANGLGAGITRDVSLTNDAYIPG